MTALATLQTTLVLSDKVSATLNLLNDGLQRFQDLTQAAVSGTEELARVTQELSNRTQELVQSQGKLNAGLEVQLTQKLAGSREDLIKRAKELNAVYEVQLELKQKCQSTPIMIIEQASGASSLALQNTGEQNFSFSLATNSVKEFIKPLDDTLSILDTFKSTAQLYDEDLFKGFQLKDYSVNDVLAGLGSLKGKYVSLTQAVSNSISAGFKQIDGKVGGSAKEIFTNFATSLNDLDGKMNNFWGALKGKSSSAIQAVKKSFQGLNELSLDVKAPVNAMSDSENLTNIFSGKLPPAIEAVKSKVMGLWAVFMANPVLVILTVIIGLFVLLYSTSEEFRDFCLEMWEQIKATVEFVLNLLGGVFGTVFQNITSVVGLFAGDFVAFIAPIAQFFLTVFTSLLIHFVNIFATLHNTVASFVEFFVNVWNDPIGSVKALFLDLGSSVLGVFESIASVVDAIFKTDWSSSVSSFRDTLKSMATDAKANQEFKLEHIEMTNAAEAVTKISKTTQASAATKKTALSEAKPASQVADFSMFAGGAAIGSMAGGGGIAANASLVEVNSEQVKVICEQAQEDCHKSCVQVIPEVNITFSGPINKSADVNEIVDILANKLEEIACSCLQGA